MTRQTQYWRDVRRVNAKIEEVLGRFPAELSREIRRQVAETTPRASGRAAASWNVAANQPNENVKPEGYQNPSGAVEAGEDNMPDVLRLEDMIVYVSNGVPYIMDLNNGSSTKAPAGFVEAVVMNSDIFYPLVLQAVRNIVRI